MYRSYESQLHLDFDKSRLFNIYFSLSILLVLYGIYSIPLGAGFKLLIVIVLIILSKQIIKNRNKIVSIKWGQGNNWLIVLEQGVVYEACLLDTTYVSRFMCVLNFRLESAKVISYVVFSDSIHDEQMRRLLVRLKIEKADLFLK